MTTQMDTFKDMKASGEFSDLYIDNLVDKARVSARKKKKLNGHENDSYGDHWANHAGTYRDEDLKKGPKFYRGRKPPRGETSIRSYEDMRTAILDIQVGEKNHDEFRNVNGLNRERLRFAQSLKDRGIDYDVSDTVKMTFSEIKRDFNQRIQPFGIQY